MLHIVGVQSSGKSQVIVMFLLRHNREELQPLGQCSQGGAAGGRLVPGVPDVPGDPDLLCVRGRGQVISRVRITAYCQ